jgi:hypothetical protein
MAEDADTAETISVGEVGGFAPLNETVVLAATARKNRTLQRMVSRLEKDNQDFQRQIDTLRWKQAHQSRRDYFAFSILLPTTIVWLFHDPKTAALSIFTAVVGYLFGRSQRNNERQP